MAQPAEGKVLFYNLEQVAALATNDRLRVRDGEMPQYTVEERFQPRAAVKDPETGEITIAGDTKTLHEELIPNYSGPTGEVLTVPNGRVSHDVVVFSEKAWPPRGNSNDKPKSLTKKF